MKEQITKLTHPSMYAWFTKFDYHHHEILLNKDSNNLENGKFNFNLNNAIRNNLAYIKYSYNTVNFFEISLNKFFFLINCPKEIKGDFNCCRSLNILSFKGFPKKVEGKTDVYVGIEEQYSPNYKNKKEYKIYLAMWLELFDSITEEERWKYINEFKNKMNYGESLIPKEILLEFGVL